MFEIENARGAMQNDTSTNYASRMTRTQRLQLNRKAAGPVTKRYDNVKAQDQPQSPTAKLNEVSTVMELHQESRCDAEDGSRNSTDQRGHVAVNSVASKINNWSRGSQSNRKIESEPLKDGEDWFSPSEDSSGRLTSKLEKQAPHPSTASPYRSHSPFKTHETKSARLQAARYRTVTARYRQPSNTRELKRNLNDASIVLNEEKSSVASGASSSSSKSSLSREELGNVAKKALQLSKVSEDLKNDGNITAGISRQSNHLETKNPKTTLSSALEMESDRSVALSSVQFHSSFRCTASTASETSSNASSEQKQTDSRAHTLSNRLSRAERYASVKRSSDQKTGRLTPSSVEGGKSLVSSDTSTPGVVDPRRMIAEATTDGHKVVVTGREIDDSSTITSLTPTLTSTEANDCKKSRTDRLAAISGYRSYRRNTTLAHPAIPKIIQHRSHGGNPGSKTSTPQTDETGLKGSPKAVELKPDLSTLKAAHGSPLSYRKKRAQALKDALVKHEELKIRKKNFDKTSQKAFPLQGNQVEPFGPEEENQSSPDDKEEDNKADDTTSNTMVKEPKTPKEGEVLTEEGNGDKQIAYIDEKSENQPHPLRDQEKDEDDEISFFQEKPFSRENKTANFLNEVLADDWGTIAYESRSEDASTNPSLQDDKVDGSNAVPSLSEHHGQASLLAKNKKDEIDDGDSCDSTNTPSLILGSLEKTELTGALASFSDVDQSTLHGEGISYSSQDGSAGALSRKSGAFGPTPFLYTASTSMGTGGSSSCKASRLLMEADDGDTMTNTSDRQSTKSGSKSLSPRSTSSKDDALKFWRKNYNPNSQERTNPSRVAFSQRSNGVAVLQPVVEQEQTYTDDEEDIFSGLEDDDDEVENKPTVANTPFEEKSKLIAPNVSKTDVKVTMDQEVAELKQIHDNVVNVEPPPPPPPPPPVSKKSSENVQQSEMIPPKKRQKAMKPGKEGMIFDASGNQSVQSEMSSSLISTKSEKRRWFRKGKFSTIREDKNEGFCYSPGERRKKTADHGNKENPVSRVNEDLLDDSVVVNSMTISKAKTSKEESSVFLNLVHLFDSATTFCRQVPNIQSKLSSCYQKTTHSIKQSHNPFPFTETLPLSNPAECVDHLRHECEKLYNGEASVVKSYREKEDQGADLDQSVITSFHMPTGGQVSPTSALMAMNENERRLWEEWESRDENTVAVDADGAVKSEKKRVELQARRQQAQDELLNVVNTAVALYGGIPKGIDPPQKEVGSPKDEISTCIEEVSSSQDKDPQPNLPTKETVDEPVTTNPVNLEVFTRSLNGEGIQVLKLGRRNKWQLRFLGLIKTNHVEEVSQLPLGLLWSKRKFDASSRGLDSLKNGGRGGFLFRQLNKVEYVRKSAAAVSFAQAASKKSNRDFKSFVGVNVDYWYSESDKSVHHRSVLLCFKSEEEADSFVTAVETIKAAISIEGPSD